MTGEQNWHSLTSAQAFHSLESSPEGLTQEEAERRLLQFGPNVLVEQRKISPWPILFRQFKSFLVVILIIAVILSIGLGNVGDATVIGVLVLFACGLGFSQEYRAERALQALRRMTAPRAFVLRDRRQADIPSHELVPGDLLLIDTGDRIPADARLVEVVELRADEASLTGESAPADKTAGPLPSETPLGDRENMIYMGTIAVYGRGKAVVTATGMTTEFGKIAGMVQEIEAKKTPLQASLDRLGRWIGIGAIVICAALAAVGVIRGHEIVDMLLWGVALAVAVVPEALPAVVVIGLALGAQRMVRRQALIRRLPTVETLGSATVICSDKTGTLTQGRMVVRRVVVRDRILDVSGTGYEPTGIFSHDGEVIEPEQDEHLQDLLRIGALCNNAQLALENGEWRIKGDPTEGALVVVAAKAGLSQESLSDAFPRIGEVPFSSERKRMSTVHDSPAGRVMYSKGAPEVILDCCTYTYSGAETKELGSGDREGILQTVSDLANAGLRVLGLACKPLAREDEAGEAQERDMVFVGLAAIADPPREEARQAIEVCKKAGIETVMITGDHKSTATAIAEELGLMRGHVAVTGAELDRLDDDEFDGLADKASVYARLSPAQKVRIVDALSAKGHIVAMTGDGVNDAPALKKADIGIAMGITGTDVSKEAADMVLVDDNFASIVAAVEEGRAIVDNIRKYLMYLFSGNLGEVLALAIAILAASLLRLPPLALPLIAAQILFVNLIGDGLAAIALSVDPPDPYIMKRQPLQLRELLLSRSTLVFTVGSAIWTAGLVLGSFLWAFHSGRSVIEAQAICFVTLLLTRLVHAHNSRSDRHSLFAVGPFKNRWLWAATGGSLLLTLLVVYLPPLQGLFHTFALGIKEWGVAIGFALTILIVVEAAKLILSKSGKKPASSPRAA